MRRNKQSRFVSESFSKRLNSMLKVDFRRMFTSPLFHILCGCALVMPILILVMTTMMGGTSVVDPTTGVETTMEAFTNTWQIIGSESGAMNGMNMDMTAMCNINLIYFLAGVFLCLFVGEDFRSGYAKNLFTVRARKSDYVASKTVVGITAGAAMLLCFFVGAIFGGAVSGLPFTLGGAGVFGLVMSMLAKICLMAVFVPIFLTMSVFAKQRTWLSLLLSLFGGMLLFMMIPMLTPLDAGVMNVGLCLAGGAMFCLGLGKASNLLLSKRDLV